MTARLGWVKWECRALLYEKRFSLWMKGRVYRSSVLAAMLYGKESEEERDGDFVKD